MPNVIANQLLKKQWYHSTLLVVVVSSPGPKGCIHLEKQMLPDWCNGTITKAPGVCCPPFEVRRQLKTTYFLL